MERVAVVGSSGHARVVVSIIQQEARYRVAGLLDPALKKGDVALGLLVLGSDDELPSLVRAGTVSAVVVAIGDNHVRASVAARLESSCPGLPFVGARHPAACIADDVRIGRGVVIMAGAVVNAASSVGDFSILNTNSSLDHDCELGEFSSIAPGVVVGGGCRIGRHSAIGIGAIVSHGVQIGDNTVLGAGSLAVRDIEANVVAYGVPAKAVRPRRPGDRYL